MALALDADVSTRHLSFVETGRSQPSREMVVRLAEHLDVPLRERNELLLAAGYAPAYPETALDEKRMEAVRAAVRQVLAGHEPYPALVVDRHWEMLEANAGVALLPAGTAPEQLAPPVNALRMSLHPEGLAPRIANLGEWRAHILDRLRRQVAATADPQLASLLAELKAYPCDERSTRRRTPTHPARSSSRCGCATRRRAGLHVHRLDLRHAAGHHRPGALDRGLLPGRRPHRAGPARSFPRRVAQLSKPSPSRSSVRSHSPRRPSRRSAPASALRERDDARAQRLGRERDRPAAHVAQARGLGVAAVEQVERHARAEARGRHAQAGVAGGVGDAAAEGGPEEHREAAAGVDRAAPAVGEAQALELRERREEVLRQRRERRLVDVVLGTDRAAPAVDGVVAAPQDPRVAVRR